MPNVECKEIKVTCEFLEIKVTVCLEIRVAGEHLRK
jgi:hypothetical protein